MFLKRDPKALIAAAAPKIQDDVTLLGVAGTLAASNVMLNHLGQIAGQQTTLAGSNIGLVMLTNCYANAVPSILDLSNNRMASGALGGVTYLIERIYAAITTEGSGATVTLDISGNATPDAETCGLIYTLCNIDACEITIELPGTVAGTSDANDVPNQAYEYQEDIGGWRGADAATWISHDGTNWILTLGADIWNGPAVSMAGEYTLAGHDTITITVA